MGPTGWEEKRRSSLVSLLLARTPSYGTSERHAFFFPPKLSTRIPRVRTRSTANERVIPLYAILDELVVLAPHTSPLFPSRPRYEIELI